MKNNLFNYATGELSQDAFICWLLSFAIDEHKGEEPLLTKCAEDLLRLFVGADVKIKEIIMQYEHIDILLILENDEFVIIEDKTFSNQHGDQIKRYIEKLSVNKNIPKERIYPVYLKIVEQPYPEANVKNVSRKDLLEVFEKYIGDVNNQIFIDYYGYLCKIDRDVNAYLNTEVDITEWRKHYDHIYRGFFTHLSDEKIVDTSKGYGWGWLSNPSGGFWYLWWYSVTEEELKRNCLYQAGVSEFYLQIEDNQIAVKLKCRDDKETDVYKIRKDIFEYFKSKLNTDKEIIRQKTFRKGKHISVCYMDYNLDDYKTKIHTMQSVITGIAAGEYKYPHNEGIMRETALELMNLTRNQFPDLNSETWIDTFMRLVTLSENNPDNNDITAITKEAFCVNADNIDFLIERLDKLSVQPVQNKIIAETIAKGLAHLSAQTSETSTLEKIVELLKRLYIIFHNVIAPYYAEGLFYLAENQQDNLQAAEKLRELAKQNSDDETVIGWAKCFDERV